MVEHVGDSRLCLKADHIAARSQQRHREVAQVGTEVQDPVARTRHAKCVAKSLTNRLTELALH
eukprot:7385065-Prymnesium_polylepis.1